MIAVCSDIEQFIVVRTETAAANKGFALAGVRCFVDAFMQGGSSFLRMKLSGNKPRHRKPPIR
jgi:hypothetical protein